MAIINPDNLSLQLERLCHKIFLRHSNSIDGSHSMNTAVPRFHRQQFVFTGRDVIHADDKFVGRLGGQFDAPAPIRPWWGGVGSEGRDTAVIPLTCLLPHLNPQNIRNQLPRFGLTAVPNQRQHLRIYQFIPALPTNRKPSLRANILVRLALRKISWSLISGE